MSTSIIDTLFAAGDALAGKFMRVIGGRQDAGTATAMRVDALGQPYVVPGRGSGGAGYGRFHVAEPETIVNVKQFYDNAPLIMDTQLVGAGTATWSAATASTTMTCTTASGDSVVRQTKIYARYDPGKGSRCMVSGVLPPVKANVRGRVGYFDAANGFFFQIDSTGVSVVVRSSTSGSAVDTLIAQASWNLDTMNGAGSSGVTIDFTKFQIFVFDFGWLGGSGVQFGFLNGDRIIYCHRYNAANILAVPFISQPSLPMRWEITNTAAAASATSMLQTCGVVQTAADAVLRGYMGSFANLTSRTVSGGTALPMISIRLKAAFNRAIIYPLKWGAITGNIGMLGNLVLNGTLTGATFASASTAVEVDQAATAITGGQTIDAGLCSSNGDRQIDEQVPAAGPLILGSNIAGTADILTLVCTNLGGSGGGAGATNGYMTWREVY